VGNEFAAHLRQRRSTNQGVFRQGPAGWSMGPRRQAHAGSCAPSPISRPCA